MQLKEIPVEGITYDQIRIEKIPATPHYVPRDPQLVPAENRAVVINPGYTCMPLGAMLAVLGINRAIPFVQGAQGCTTYVRYTFCRIFKEPATIATASFHEDAAVFGGQRNVVEGIRNLVMRYWPEVIGVVTTCSSEIIGDDMISFLKMARRRLRAEIGEEKEQQLAIVLINTPSFAGSHVEGYDRATKAFLEHLATKRTFIDQGGPGPVITKGVNLLGEFDIRGDLREIEKLLARLGLKLIAVISGRLTLRGLAEARRAALNIVHCRRTGGTLAHLMEERYQIPKLKVSFFGIAETANSLLAIARFFNQQGAETWVAEEAAAARQQAAPYLEALAGKRVALFFGASRLGSMAQAFCELGMEMVLAGSQCGSVEDYREAGRCLKRHGLMLDDGNLQELTEFLARHRPHLMVGGNRERFVAHKLGVPFLAFPQQNGPYAGFSGFVNLAREAAATISAPVWRVLTPPWEKKATIRVTR